MNLRIAPTDTSFCKYRDHAKVLIFFQKVVQLFNIIREFFPIRDSMRLECVKKCFVKEEILPHYQNSRFFQTYANFNKMSGPLHVRIDGCILY